MAGAASFGEHGSRKKAMLVPMRMDRYRLLPEGLSTVTARGMQYVVRLLLATMLALPAGIVMTLPDGVQAEDAVPIPRPAPARPDSGDANAAPPAANDDDAAAVAPDDAGEPMEGDPDFVGGDDLDGPVQLLQDDAATAAPPLPEGVDLPPQDVVLEARLIADGDLIPSGISWRVFGQQEGPDGKLPLVAQATGGAVTVSLKPGDYFLHAAFGRAGATQRLYVRPGDGPHDVVLNAGGLRLHAVVGKDRPLAPNQVVFDIFASDEDETGERTLVAPNAGAEQITRLNAGTYHVVSRYGDTNSVVRADIQVRPGELTDATLFHEAARVTLKLVSARGGEALANTAWSVSTSAGDPVFNSVGAFPSVILAAGEYTAVAKLNGQTYQSKFNVEADVNRDIEVLTTTSAVQAQ